MESDSQQPRHRPRIDRMALSVLVWVAVVATCAPGATWLDSGELAAAGAGLGIPHAPGHPLYVLLAHLATWIPLGPIAFRVALLSGACAAAAAWFTADLVEELSGSDRPSLAQQAAGLLVAVLLVATSAVWQQSVRAEVYTLHLALILWATRDALRWATREEARTRAGLARVGLIIGLALTNHHLLTLLHLPALLVLLGTAPCRPEDTRWGRFLRAVCWTSPLAVVYAVLPLRALTDPLINYGDPRTLSRFMELVSAEVFQGSVVTESPSIGANLLTAIEMLSNTAGAPILLMAAGGIWLVARRSPAVGAAIALAIVGNLASKVSMVIDPSNPDALGYFQTTLALAAVTSGVAIAWSLEHGNQVIRSTGLGVAGLALLWTGTATALSYDGIDHAEARTASVTDMALLRHTPPGAVWMTSNTFLHFNRLAHQSMEGYRPDVVTVHQGFEKHVDGGAPLRDVLVRRHPELEAFANAGVTAPVFPTQELLALARERPVLLEPTFGLPLPLTRLGFQGGYLRVLNDERSPGDDLELQRFSEAQLRVTAGPAIRDRREARTVHAILWLQLAVVRLQQGEAESAASALDHVEALAPGTPYAARLRPLVDQLARAGGRRGKVLSRIRSIDFTTLFN